MKPLIAITLFILGNSLFSQSLQSGLIFPKSVEDAYCCIYVAKDGFKVYDKPNGKLIGLITSKDDSFSAFFTDHSTKKISELNHDDLFQVGYDIAAIPFFERKNGFVRILNKNHNYWLKESEVKLQSFELVEWQRFLAENANNVLGFYANEPGLNLREKPTTDSKVIMTLKTDNQQIVPTNEHKGLWTKVKVIITKEHVCETSLSEKENFVKIKEGWIKIMDDGGMPNVHFYARGC